MHTRTALQCHSSQMKPQARIIDWNHRTDTTDNEAGVSVCSLPAIDPFLFSINVDRSSESPRLSIIQSQPQLSCYIVSSLEVPLEPVHHYTTHVFLGLCAFDGMIGIPDDGHL